jgi:hypothetical protein
LSSSQKIIGKETKMKLKNVPTLVALMPVAGFVALTLSLSVGAASVWADSEKHGRLRATKECSQNTGKPGDYCTFTSSNLAEIVVGSKIFYDQAFGIPAGMLDSNVILDAGFGNRAVGRCTLDGATRLGLCTFSDGLGAFAGFEARVNVSYRPLTNDFLWQGTYSFDHPDR